MSIVSVDPEAGATVGFARFLRETDCGGGETVMFHCLHFIVTFRERPDRTNMLNTRHVDPNTRASVASSKTNPAAIAEIVEPSAPLAISELMAMITVPRRCRKYSQFVSP